MKTKNKEVKQEILYSKQVFDEVSLDALGPECEEAWEKYRKTNKSKNEKVKLAFNEGFAMGRNRSTDSLLKWVRKLKR